MKNLLLPFLGLALATSAQAATVFLTNNTSPKTLASNEGDAGSGLTTGGADDGNNNGLHGDTAGASTVLTLSADDGGGAITFSTSDVSGGNNLFMDGDSMGHGNDKWGANQNWTFSLDQTISFDALTFGTINEEMILQSDAWIGNSDISGGSGATAWSFDGTLGQFTFGDSSNGAASFDFTSAGVSNVTAGTSIAFGYFASAGGGESLESFQISVVPEPSTFGLLAGCFAMAWVMVRRRA